MTHSLGEAWALDDDHRDRVSDHTAHGFCTDLAGPHVPNASRALAETVVVDSTQELATEHARRVRAGGSLVECAQPSWPGAPPPRPGPQGFLQR